MRIEQTLMIHSTLERLFQHIEDPEKQKLWMPGLVANELTSPAPAGPGSTFRLVMKTRGGTKESSFDGEILTREPPHRLEIRFWGGDFPSGFVMRVDYRLSEAGSGIVRLEYLAEADTTRLGWLMRLMMRLLAFMGKRHAQQVLGRLRKVVEEATPAGEVVAS